MKSEANNKKKFNENDNFILNEDYESKKRKIKIHTVEKV